MQITLEEAKEKIETIAEVFCRQIGIDLIEVKVGGHMKDVIVQVTTDRPMGGISIEQCSTLNRSLITAIDEAAILPEDCYSLEVSSPGLDRPLTTHKDFLRNLNSEMRLYLHEPVNGKKEINVLLTDATPDALTVTVKKEQVVIPLKVVQKGMLII
jgi:ribosome maturation factor RimP